MASGCLRCQQAFDLEIRIAGPANFQNTRIYIVTLRISYALSLLLVCFPCKQLISKLISSMSHKAKGLSRNPCRNKESSLSLGEVTGEKLYLWCLARSQKQHFLSN
jgi:hypothetical protein